MPQAKSLSHLFLFFTVLLVSIPAGAKSAEAPPGSYLSMDYGPVISETISAEWPKENLTLKGISVRLAHDSSIVFDTALMRWSTANTGGWIDLSKASHMSFKGSKPPVVEGEKIFATRPVPGWAFRESFEDPREERGANLPREWALWNGFYRFGDRVVVSYRIDETEILETPAAIEVDGRVVFGRQIRTKGAEEELLHYLAEFGPDAIVEQAESGFSVWEGEERVHFRIRSEIDGARFRFRENRVELRLPKHDEAAELFLFVWKEKGGSEPVSLDLAGAISEISLDFDEVRRGGPALWEEEVKTGVVIAGDEAAYVVDEVELPFENPWESWFRPTAFDFFADGDRAAVSTWNGDIWIVSGLQGEGGELEWKRFATGLFYPMGIAVIGEMVHVTERSQLTRLHDLNGDGEADFYESVNNDGVLYPMAHSLCLEVDAEGNFYFFKNGNRVPEGIPEHGALVRVSADGKRREPIASGIRGANGLGIGPDGRIFGADQEGNWVPTSRVDWIQEGGFYGYRPHNPTNRPEGDYDLPVTWIPHYVDASSAAVTYIGDERAGPIFGNWVLASYGSSVLLQLFIEEKNGLLQGGVAKFPLEFDSGLMRAVVNPADGQLWVLGMRGWGTTAQIDGAFSRIRHTGLPSRMPKGISVEPGEVRIDFAAEIDPVSLDLENFEVERWRYAYTSRYGSAEFSVENPEKEGHDPVAVSGVRLSEDRRGVILEIPDLKPVMQQSIAYRLVFADGAEVEDVVYQTIHRVAGNEVPGPDLRGVVAKGKPEPEVKAEENAEPELGPELVAGREVYLNTCISCHQPGGGGAAPEFSKSEWAGGNPDALIRIVLQGKMGTRGVMAPFGWLSDEDLASVLSYIRVRWHEGEAVSAEKVGEVRKATEGRTKLWTEEELRPFAGKE